jgi:SagB-type dehydrogenase family enzyme
MMASKHGVSDASILDLPPPKVAGSMTLEAAIKARRSVRTYAPGALTLEQVGQLLWAVQGITHDDDLRAAPSAGALYPLQVYLVAGQVAGVPAGVYRYEPQQHQLKKVVDGDRRAQLCQACLSQEYVSAAPASVVICAVYARTKAKYGSRATRYVDMEVGCAAENVYLQATAMHLGTVFIGACDDAQVAQVIGAAADEAPRCIMPVGKIK